APDFRPADVLKYSPVNETLPPLIGKAFQIRPDLKMLESEAHAMGATVAEFRSDYLPTVNAVAGYEGAGTGLPVVNNFNAGIVITWPIFNSFLTTDQIAEAKFRQQELRNAMEDLRQTIILQVNTAFLNWQASVQRIERAQKALLASRAELQLSEQRYQSGLTNIVELEDAERHYTSDDAQYAEALYGYSVAKAAVEQVTGQSLSNA
ncbi:MAG: TolC family protein, partial [Candidatus Binataceae bacterium]